MRTRNLGQRTGNGLIQCNNNIGTDTCMSTLNIVKASTLMSQEITEILVPIAFTNVDISSGNAITFDAATSTFNLLQSGIYQVSFKCTTIKTSLSTPDVGALLVQNGNTLIIDSYERFTIGEIAAFTLSNTSYLQISGSASLQLATGAMFTRYSSSFMAVTKLD